ncbi:hypothetical protein Bca4012_055279 [Brassica carinata]|uniref:F-box associated beta-propeller type 3 domain-containing protein n=1 Tax=Brassica carinata TaxID=52824 RepID=A0A8X7VWG2_BRACI|nr:hypothetical protein Bca52824_011725 [Brassica carinata]
MSSRRINYQPRPDMKHNLLNRFLTLESGKRVWRRVERKFHFVKNYGIKDEDMELGYHSSTLTLFNYKGKLGIHDYTYGNRYENILVFWILEDAGNRKLWSEHSYELSPLIVRYNWIVGMTSTGEVVWTPYNRERSKPFYSIAYSVLLSGSYLKYLSSSLLANRSSYSSLFFYLRYESSEMWMRR